MRLFVVLSCGSGLCVAILGSDVGQNRSENVGDHKLASDLAKNRSENSPSRPKTGRRFSVSDLSPMVNAKADAGCHPVAFYRHHGGHRHHDSHQI